MNYKVYPFLISTFLIVIPIHGMLQNPHGGNGCAVFNPPLFSELDKVPGVISGFITLIDMQPTIFSDGSKIFRAIACINYTQRLVKTRYYVNNSLDHANNILDRSYGTNGIEYGPSVSSNRVLEDKDDIKSNNEIMAALGALRIKEESAIEKAAKISLPLDLREDLQMDVKPYPFSECINSNDFFLKAICVNPRMHPGGQIFEAIAIINGKRRLLQSFYNDDDNLDRTFGNNGIYSGPEVDETFALGGFSSLDAAKFSGQVYEKGRRAP